MEIGIRSQYSCGFCATSLPVSPVVTLRTGAEGLAQETQQNLAQGSRRPRRRATPAVRPASVTREHLPRTWCPHRGHPCLTAVKASSLPTVVRGVRNIRRTHNRGYDPQLLIRTERPLSREIAKIARRTLARPVSEKIGFPEFARINAETSIDILPSIHPFCPRIGKRHRSPSQARKGRVRPFANAPGKWTAIEVLRRELDAIQM